MKVMTILGTRPEIIRLSRVIGKLDSQCDHVLVHTGQNFDKNLSDIFFRELKIRTPDHFLRVKGSTSGEQIAQILGKTEEILSKEKPDKLLILGDTNSSLSAIIAKRMGIPVFHMEAGNRCYDDRVPEEVSRRIIDHCSDVLLPYTGGSRSNLIREGIANKRIFVTGNPILEVIAHYKNHINRSTILKQLEISKGGYFLVTVHRAENVDDVSRLRQILSAILRLKKEYDIPVICSLHPHTRNNIQKFRIKADTSSIQFHEPFGFFNFIRLEKEAMCVLSDSGTVQEECCILHIPNVTLRDVTERPETVACGSNVLSGADEETIIRCVRAVLSQPPEWEVPREYLNKSVSTTVQNIIVGWPPTSNNNNG